MTINMTAIEDIGDVVIAFVPIMLLVSIVGWLLQTFRRGF